MSTTKNATNSIEVRECDGMGILVELIGEFDAHDLDLLRNVLGEAQRLEPPVHADLSRVTFLDARCARELVVRSRLYGSHFTLSALSWQVQASLRVCGLGAWTAEHLGDESFRGTKFRKDVETKPYEDLAIGV